MASENDILDELEYYDSSHTGEEIDHGIDSLINMAQFIRRNITIPYAIFDGYSTEVQLTDTSSDGWIKGIVVKTVTALPSDAADLTFQVVLGSTVLLTVPPEVLMAAGSCVFFPLERQLPANSKLRFVASGSCSSIGEIDIKVNMS